MFRKGENGGYQQFLLSPQCFKKAIIQGSYNPSLSNNGLHEL